MAVIWYDSSETGAPVLNNAAGSLLSVVQACLVDGFNTKSVTTLSVTANVATATISAHGYSNTYGKLVRVAGAANALLNGDKQITVVDANTVTYPAPGVANGTVSGTITMKRAPLDWARLFSGTNKAIYRSLDGAAYGQALRIDDTNAGGSTPTDARAVGVESATDVDTFVSPFPTAAQLSGGHFWNKGANTAATKPWVLIGDERAFYIFTGLVDGSASNGFAAQGFGDLVSYKTGEIYGAFSLGRVDAWAGIIGNGNGFGRTTNFTIPDVSIALARVSSGAGGGVGGAMVGVGAQMWGAFSVGFGTSPSYPSPVDNGMVVHRPVWCAEQNAAFNNPIRGEFPGIAQPLGAAPFTHLDVVEGFTGFAGKMLAVRSQNYQITGRVLIDLTGPWR